ncbi:hypothetical protein DSO57_1004286 [Entomophthora muscae]|uniref:Uncharacterized protein n=1 Tax=Entomophthora muscae TaxID=34485 RepID=A0ACC2TW02_9FUNG|nr:hypothetical protein DSO57_1004286 [Entomophthora muscae]
MKATLNVSSLNINFKHVGYSGLEGDYEYPRNLLNFPGISEEKCVTVKYMKKDVDFCFLVQEREMVLSDPYYPKGLPVCKGNVKCHLHADVVVGVPVQFYPQSGLAPTIIPAFLDPKLSLYNAAESSKVYYTVLEKRRMWIRNFYWLYKGTYTISSRRFSKFNFTVQWPALLSSGKPKFIYGLCSITDILSSACSINAFL